MNKPAQDVGAPHSVSGKGELTFRIRTAIVPSLGLGPLPTFQTGLGSVMLWNLIVNLNTFGCTLVPEIFPQCSMRPVRQLLSGDDVGSLLGDGVVGYIPHISDCQSADVVLFAPIHGCSADLVFQIPPSALLTCQHLLLGALQTLRSLTPLAAARELLLEMFEFLAGLLSKGA